MKRNYIYVSTKYHDPLNLSKFPSTGRYGNISGMRNLYWGKDAYIIKCGAYAYKVNQETFERAYDMVQNFRLN